MKRKTYRINKINKLSNYERGWIEALIDGEGCIGLHKQSRRTKRGKTYGFSPVLAIANCNVELLEKAQRIIGAGSISKMSKKVNKTIYKYFLSSNGLRKLLPQINLIVKRKHKQILLKALKYLKLRDGAYGKWYNNKFKKELLTLRRKMLKLNGK